MTKEKYFQYLKNLFDDYRKNESHEKLQKVLYRFVHRKLWQKRGPKGVPLMEQSWFTDEMESEFKLCFAIQIMLWLDDKPNFSEIDFDKPLEIAPYDSFTNDSWYYKVMVKIYDHIVYAFKKKYLSLKEIVERMKEKYHIIEPIITEGKMGTWQSQEALQHMRRQEMKLIKQIFGTPDRDRKLSEANDMAIGFANEKSSEVIAYVKKHDYKIVWTWMLKHLESPLWHLLTVIDLEEFEFFFLNFLGMDFKTPTIQSVDRAVLISQIFHIKEQFPDYTNEEIADHMNHINDDIFITSGNVKKIIQREQNKIKEKKIICDPEVEIEKIIHPLATRISYLKNKLQILRAGIEEQKKQKEFTDMPEPPACLFAWEDFIKDKE